MAARRLEGDLHVGPRIFLHIPHASLSGIGAPTPQLLGGMKDGPSSWMHILFYQQGARGVRSSSFQAPPCQRILFPLYILFYTLKEVNQL